ncbi:hypothetical protein AVEN_255032-1 [Araneus ventricosus]|uniref:Uncharacterized protein n=1 Tax=Araneus ventricosus TaxID=182803 RepID=A0A4Y2LU98_ARAVE|nr:hypothetical protein AVEN_255032-1 [Araneus ventricosus]
MLDEVNNKIQGNKLIEIKDNIINFETEDRINDWEVQRLNWGYLEMEDERMIYTDESKVDGKVVRGFVNFINGNEYENRVHRISENFRIYDCSYGDKFSVENIIELYNGF